MRRHARDPRRPRDAGVSLAEVLVAMMIFGLVGTMVAAVGIRTSRTSAGLQNRIDNTTQGELGLAAVSKVLRTAVLPEQLEDRTCIGCADSAIVTATSTQVVFYANVGDTSVGPSLVTLLVEADPQNAGTMRLVQQTKAPIAGANDSYSFCTTGAAGCTVASRVLARGLLSPSPGVLTYYDYEGAAMTSSTLTAANLARISSIDVVITVQTRPGRPEFPSRTALTRVQLPNVEINVQQDPT